MKRGISTRKFIYNVILYGCIRLKVREKIARGVALALTAALVVTGVDFTVFAAAGSDGRKAKGVITAFADLDESVTMQSLPVGAEESEIHFPETLMVTLETKSKQAQDGDTTQSEGSTQSEDTTQRDRKSVV